ncbi:hypothetical protein Q664_35075, partial [Archangium violaceum Cb vi76]
MLLCLSSLLLGACGTDLEVASELESPCPDEGCASISNELLGPSVPREISHVSYTSKPAFTVSWSFSLSLNGPVTYELYEQRGNGAWQMRYRGLGRSFGVTGRTSGVYRYRVRGCNSVGCGGYRTGSQMIVNLPPDMKLYSQLPFLAAHDQQNAQYASTQVGFRSDLAELSATSSSSAGDGLFYLGQGFDLLLDAYSQFCLNNVHPDFRVKKVPVGSSSMSINLSTSTTHLFSLLDVSMSGALSFEDGGYRGELAGGKARVIHQVTDIYQKLIVLRWSYEAESWSLETPIEQLKPEFVDLLSLRDANQQKWFRARCGDKYVNSLTQGAKLYMVFRFDGKRFSAQESESAALSLEANLKTSLNANGTSQVSAQTRELLEKLNVSVEAYSVGGDPLTLAGISQFNFDSVFQAFVNSVKPANHRVVTQTLRDYEIPLSLSNYSYFQIFTNYNPMLQNLKNWILLDIQRDARCDLLKSYGQWTEDCLKGHQDLQTAKTACMNANFWNECRHPSVYETPGPDAPNPGVIPEGENLFSWLGTRIHQLEKNTRSQYKSYHIVDNGIFDKDCEPISASVCLPEAECVIDTLSG